MNRSKLYLLVILGCAVGYGWLAYGLSAPLGSHSMCMVKEVTGFPCPSCGTTRSIISLWGGDVGTAFWYNPLGFALSAFLLIAPLWILGDFILIKSSFHKFFRSIEGWFANRAVALSFAAAMLVNWIWNIVKGL